MLYQYASPRPSAPLVVKYGGNAMGCSGEPDPVLAELAELRAAGSPVVLVHGGGPEIDRRLKERGIVTQRIDGLRVTDAATLETTEAVLCANVNKRIVRACLALGLPAVGISGEDGALLIAERTRSASGSDLGFVGGVTACRPAILHTLLAAGFVPVVAPLAIAADGSSALNVNADLAAAAISAALQATAFVAITNVSRVLRDPDDASSGVERFSIAQARAFVESDACRSSMKPKLRAAIAAVEGGVGAAYICNVAPRAIRNALAGDATVITLDEA